MRAPALRPLVLVAALATAVAGPAGAQASCPALSAPAAGTDDFAAGPQYGRAPLQVRMGWWTTPVDDPVSFEIDVDGSPVARQARDTGLYTHVFTEPGLHSVMGRVIGRTGQTVARTVSIDVRPAGDFDAEVSALWANFKSAVARGDVSGALECVTSRTRDRTRGTLTPGGSFARAVGPYGDTLTFVRKASSVDLEYSTDFVNGRALTVILSPDVDWVWRLDASGWR